MCAMENPFSPASSFNHPFMGGFNSGTVSPCVHHLIPRVTGHRSFMQRNQSSRARHVISMAWPMDTLMHLLLELDAFFVGGATPVQQQPFFLRGKWSLQFLLQLWFFSTLFGTSCGVLPAFCFVASLIPLWIGFSPCVLFTLFPLEWVLPWMETLLPEKHPDLGKKLGTTCIYIYIYLSEKLALNWFVHPFPVELGAPRMLLIGCPARFCTCTSWSFRCCRAPPGWRASPAARRDGPSSGARRWRRRDGRKTEAASLFIYIYMYILLSGSHSALDQRSPPPKIYFLFFSAFVQI